MVCICSKYTNLISAHYLQLTQTQMELAAAEEKNKELTEKLAQLSTEHRDATKRHTLRFEILRDMLGLELLRNTDPANLAIAADSMKASPREKLQADVDVPASNSSTQQNQ
jgi:hypothetical protein